MQPARTPKRLGRRRARQLQQRRRRDERLLLQELIQRAEGEARPRNDEEPLPRID